MRHVTGISAPLRIFERDTARADCSSPGELDLKESDAPFIGAQPDL